MEEFIKQFLIEKALILIPCLVIIGAILKATPKFPNWAIPHVMLVLGIVGGITLLGFTPNGVIQGVLAGGTAVFSNQIVKHTTQAIEISTFNTKDGGQ